MTPEQTTSEIEAEVEYEFDLADEPEDLGIDTHPVDTIDAPQETSAITADFRELLLTPEAPGIGELLLPGQRTAEDFRPGELVLAFVSMDANGTRKKLIPGKVAAVREADEASPGFLNIDLMESPGGYIVDADYNTVIPREALSRFRSEPGLLEEWVASGRPEGVRNSVKLKQALAGWVGLRQVEIAELPEEPELLELPSIDEVLTSLDLAESVPHRKKTVRRSLEQFPQYGTGASRPAHEIESEKYPMFETMWNNLHREIADFGFDD